MRHILDNPAWHALKAPQVRDGLARHGHQPPGHIVSRANAMAGSSPAMAMANGQLKGPLILLGADDAADMPALAEATQPGPFGARTHLLGRYIGYRDSGRLLP